MKRRSCRIGLEFAVCFLSFSAVIHGQAEKPSEEQIQFFEKHIRPAFSQYCYECHSLKSGRTHGGLLVDSHDGLMQGGESGPAISPGRLDESLLWGAITWSDYEMPPKQQMPDSVIANFKKWIEMGAPDPRIRQKIVVDTIVDPEQGKEHWAFQLPAENADADIDAFIDARLSGAGIAAVKPAGAGTLLRRLNFDLIGLPPGPAEVEAFSAAWKKNSRQAIESKVDELLARPQFGERWGRHWLDVARYAESSGMETNFTFPHAWRYRDYVIDALNHDKPYDEFIAEQVAGDLLPAESTAEHQENLIATGFLALGTKSLNERNPRQFRMDVVDEQIDTMSQAILGITVACARCHDHKFDPIPTADYYAMAGIFLSTDTLYGTAAGLQNRRPAELIELPIADKQVLARSYTPSEIKEMRSRIDELKSTMRTARRDARRKGERVEQRKMVVLRNQIARLTGILATLELDGSPRTYGMGVMDAPSMTNARVLVRGDVEMPAQEVERGFLQVLEIDAQAIGQGSSGRLELAQWLTSKDNPLTARVMANRVWLHLFGEGLVRSPNNWGVTGEIPTHPELLDYLAVKFRNEGWSTKSLIREIVLSNAYQRSSKYDAQNHEVDADNRLLWRANPRQLDAESLRDAMLAASGKLNVKRPVASVISQLGNQRVGRQLDAFSVYDPQDDYRSVYLPVVRNMVPPSLAVFDFPDPQVTTAKRVATNVPSQALYLMNNTFVLDQSKEMAKGLWKDFDSPRDRIQHAFLQAYGRPATAMEIRASTRFVSQLSKVRPSYDVKSTSPIAVRGRAALRERFQRGSGMQQEFMQGGLPRRRRFADRQNFRGNGSELLSGDKMALMLFCQSLLASAEFRILD